MATTDSGTDNNKKGGLGSTYGGTQSSDPKAPDGYQKPKGKMSDESTAAFGGEYADDSSYGDKEQNPDTAAGEKGSAGTDARGSGVSKGSGR